jgi:hypothetical protein
MLAALLNRSKYRDHEGEKLFSYTLSRQTVFGEALGELGSEYKGFKGSSVYLSETLKPLFKETIPQESRFEATFDRFEYLSTLVRADSYVRTTDDKSLENFPLQAGWFVFRNLGRPEDILRIVDQEVEKMGDSWPPLKTGLFDGNVGRLTDIKKNLDRVRLDRSAPTADADGMARCADQRRFLGFT